ncbi:MAG: hypothetical protein LIO90_04005 [Bacteroidales bacterium]|nr:hypothetical protein [Bacteroidales bacterium]
MNPHQLNALKNYLNDNPRRLVIKRAHPDYFIVRHKRLIAGRECEIIGIVAR